MTALTPMFYPRTALRSWSVLRSWCVRQPALRRRFARQSLSLLRRAGLLALLCLLSNVAAAAELQTQLRLGLGYGEYSSVLHQADDRRFHLLPRWQLYYDRFYLENLDVGFNLLEQPAWSLDLSGKQSFDALLTRGSGLKNSVLTGLVSTDLPIPIPVGHSDSVADLIEPARRHFSYLAGATVYYRHDNWQFSSAFSQDVSQVHHGNEWQSSLSWRWQRAAAGVELTGSVRRLDSKYSNYYFGLWRGEFRNEAYQYAPGSQWLPSVKIALRLRLTDQLDFVANWRREFLPSANRNSLYIADLQQDLWFSGVTLQW